MVILKRIGIFGGAFNPIHLGHLAVAQAAQEKFKLDKVIFIPSCQSPHKTAGFPVSAENRLRMVRLAIAGNPLFGISDVEIARGGKSYTVDTIKHFRKIFPVPVKLYFIVGEDSFLQLKAWKSIDEILTLAACIVVNRPGYTVFVSGLKHVTATMPGIDISSSFLRQRLTQEKSVRYLVPESVFKYIEKKRLYKNINEKRSIK